MPVPYNTMFLTVENNEDMNPLAIKLNGAPYCYRLSAVARLGNVDTCGVDAENTVLSERILTNFTPINI